MGAIVIFWWVGGGEVEVLMCSWCVVWERLKLKDEELEAVRYGFDWSL
jgi:hypothetical protein